MKLKKLVYTTAVAGALAAAPVAAKADSTTVYGGFDAKESVYNVNIGAITALQGQNILTQDGYLVRGDLGYGQYDYDTTALGNIDGDVSDASLMLGYGYHFSAGSAAAYVGGSYEHQNLSPDDPNNSADGGQGGLKMQVDMNLTPAQNIGLDSSLAYSTGYQTYNTHFDATYDFGTFKAGPEAAFLGNKEYSQRRYGGALSDIDVGFAKTKLYAGWADSNGTTNDSSVYGGVGFSRNF